MTTALPQCCLLVGWLIIICRRRCVVFVITKGGRSWTEGCHRCRLDSFSVDALLCCRRRWIRRGPSIEVRPLVDPYYSAGIQRTDAGRCCRCFESGIDRRRSQSTTAFRFWIVTVSRGWWLLWRRFSIGRRNRMLQSHCTSLAQVGCRSTVTVVRTHFSLICRRALSIVIVWSRRQRLHDLQNVLRFGQLFCKNAGAN